MTTALDNAALKLALDNGELQLSAQVMALLRELQAMLNRLAHHGETNSVDIRSLPLSPGDYDLLAQFLGDGEVSASINALGLSKIKETRFSGIWWLRHYNSYDEIVAELIEVTALPDILKTQDVDLKQSSDILQQYLQKL